MSDPVNYVLVNSFGEEYALGNAWMPNISPAATGYNVAPKYQRPGGMANGDPEIGPRRINFALTDSQEDYAIYIQPANDIKYLCRHEARPIFLEERRSGFRQEVLRATSGDTANKGAWRHIGEKTISFHLLTGNWEYIDAEEADSVSFLASEESLSVNNPEREDVDCLITVTPQTAIGSFTITNTANGQGLTINNGSFRPGRVITIDGTGIGEIKMNGQNIKMSLAGGSTYIRLKPGINPLVYSSSDGACRLQVSFRPQREEV